MYQNVANKIIHRFNIDYIRFKNVFDHSIAKNIEILHSKFYFSKIMYFV